MNDQKMPQDSWQACHVSAWIDGEPTESSAVSWGATEREQLYYFSLTRQVIRREAVMHPVADSFARQQAAWTVFWSRVDTL